jgi:Lamin Tail Domain
MSVNAIKTFSRQLCQAALLVLIMSKAAMVAKAAVVINEIMLNPINPAHGQWFEMYNTDNMAVSLQGWYICASNGFSSCFYFSSSASIAANGYLTIGENNAAGYVDLVWSDMPTFPKDGSAMIPKVYNVLSVIRSDVTEADKVSWDINSDYPNLRLLFPMQPGASLRRMNVQSRTQDIENWAPSLLPIHCVAGNDSGAPGEHNDKTSCSTIAPTLAPTKAPAAPPTPAPVAATPAPTTAPVSIPYSYNFYGPVILLNEIMLHPLHPATQGQWYEFYNPNNEAISLQGWFMSAYAAGFSVVDKRFYFPSTASIAAKGYLTVGQNNVAGVVDLVWSDLPTLAAGDPTGNIMFYDVRIHRPDGSTAGMAVWNIDSPGTYYHLPFSSTQTGVSLSRTNTDPTMAYSLDTTIWTPSTTLIQCTAGNDKGTPGQGNDKTCPAGNGGGGRTRVRGLRQ